MDFTNLKFCQRTDKRRPNIQPYRLLSSSTMSTTDFPFVPLDGHKVGSEPTHLKPTFEANDFFKSQSIRGCHQLPVIIGGFVTKQTQDATCQKLAAFSHNILDSLSKRNFPGLYILSEGIQARQPSSSQHSDQPKAANTALIADHSAASFSARRSYANIARQSYATVATKMASPLARCRPQQRRSKRNSNYFNRNNCETFRRYSDDKSNWRDRSDVKDVRRDVERKPRYLVERHPNCDQDRYRASKASRSYSESGRSRDNYRSSESNPSTDYYRSSKARRPSESSRPLEVCPPSRLGRSAEPCRSADACSNWRCRQHPQKTSAKTETLRRCKELAMKEEEKEEAEIVAKDEPTSVKVKDDVKPSDATKCAVQEAVVELVLSTGLQCLDLLLFHSDSDASSSDEETDEEDEEAERLREVNARWRAQNSEPVAERAPGQTKVQFRLPATVHRLVCWSFASRAARCGPWEEMARDRARFHLRVVRTQPLLAAVFSEDNRRRARALTDQRYS